MYEMNWVLCNHMILKKRILVWYHTSEKPHHLDFIMKDMLIKLYCFKLEKAK